jgi:hypothetical protein
MTNKTYEVKPNSQPVIVAEPMNGGSRQGMLEGVVLGFSVDPSAARTEGRGDDKVTFLPIIGDEPAELAEESEEDISRYEGGKQRSIRTFRLIQTYH